MSSTLVLSDVGDETWGAVLENGQVVELHVENTRRAGIAGNIYKGRVGRVLPGIQSAFIDIGIGKDVFLHVSDVSASSPDTIDLAGDIETAQDTTEATDGPGGDVASEEGAADAEEAPIGNTQILDGGTETGAAGSRRLRPLAPIQDVVREGQEILVQVARESIGPKGARVTAQI